MRCLCTGIKPRMARLRHTGDDAVQKSRKRTKLCWQPRADGTELLRKKARPQVAVASVSWKPASRCRLTVAFRVVAQSFVRSQLVSSMRDAKLRIFSAWPVHDQRQHDRRQL